MNSDLAPVEQHDLSADGQAYARALALLEVVGVHLGGGEGVERGVQRGGSGKNMSAHRKLL